MFRKAMVGLKMAVPAALLAMAFMVPGAEAAQTRALKIYHVHSHEKATIVFKRNGRYDPKGLKQLNMILRDWRKNEPTRMDPRLFDLIWEVYQKSGSRDYIHVIGGYRSAGTNAMLRSRSKGVAEKSQHILGKAMDFYIPDVPLRKLREIGVKFQVGGVGFYPTSGSPFVHMDVGGVRAWPRLPRRELARLFPDGKTLHRPAEGGTMPGYAAALADYRKRVDADSILVAGGGSKDTDSGNRRSKSLLAALFSGGDEDEEEIVEASTEMAKAEETKPAKEVKNKPEPILTAAVDEKDLINAPVPGIRPTYENSDSKLRTALLSQKTNPAEEAMQAALVPQPDPALVPEAQKEEFVNLATVAVPVPQLLGSRKRPGDSEAVIETASADPVAEPDPLKSAMVPMPVERPAINVAAKGEDDLPVADVKPEEIAALAAETGPAADDKETDTDEVAGIIDSLDAADAKDNADNGLAEMAALDVPKQTVTRSITIPNELRTSDAEPVRDVKKGGRPKAKNLVQKTDAKKPGKSKELTGNLIAKWAIDKGRVDQMAKPVKAPRFVASALTRQPDDVYAAGFNTKIDPARFGGEGLFGNTQ
jgi:uncharacterized protein YcbK (DUF882 family)